MSRYFSVLLGTSRTYKYPDAHTHLASRFAKESRRALNAVYHRLARCEDARAFVDRALCRWMRAYDHSSQLLQAGPAVALSVRGRGASARARTLRSLTRYLRSRDRSRPRAPPSKSGLSARSGLSLTRRWTPSKAARDRVRVRLALRPRRPAGASAVDRGETPRARARAARVPSACRATRAQKRCGTRASDATHTALRERGRSHRYDVRAPLTRGRRERPRQTEPKQVLLRGLRLRPLRALRTPAMRVLETPNRGKPPRRRLFASIRWSV